MSLAWFSAKKSLSPAAFAELREVNLMRIDFGLHGDWLVDPFELAVRFNVSSAYLKRLKVLGRVEVVVEPVNPQAPTETRVKVCMMDRVWRGIFDASGKLIREEMY